MKLKETQGQTKREIVASFFHKFTVWLNGRSRNQFVNSDDGIIQVYVRKGHHMVGDKLHNTLDIARIEIDDQWQNKGLGTAVINGIHSVNPFPITFIESILNPTFYERLKRQGWMDVLNSVPPCVYKETGRGDELHTKTF